MLVSWLSLTITSTNHTVIQLSLNHAVQEIRETCQLLLFLSQEPGLEETLEALWMEHPDLAKKRSFLIKKRERERKKRWEWASISLFFSSAACIFLFMAQPLYLQTLLFRLLPGPVFCCACQSDQIDFITYCWFWVWTGTEAEQLINSCSPPFGKEEVINSWNFCNHPVGIMPSLPPPKGLALCYTQQDRKRAKERPWP